MKEITRRIVIVTELFYPEESATAHILTTIAGGLQDTFDVLVLTGPVSYENEASRLTSQGEETNVEVRRIWAPRLNKNKPLPRFFRLMIISIGLGLSVFVRSKKSDIVFSVTNPAPILVFLALIKKLKGFTLALLIHDVFPENAVAAGFIRKGNMAYGSIKWLFDWSYTAANSVIVIGRDMEEVVYKKIKKKKKDIVLIENWADPSFKELAPYRDTVRRSLGLTDKIVIQYAGNIGRAQGILEFVRLVSQVKNSNLHYMFCGSGALSDQLSEYVKEFNNLSLIGSYPRGDQGNILASCDVALVVLAPGMYGLGVPSKAYNIMAAGKPILFLGPKNSEIYRLVTGAKIGWAFDWHDKEEMVKLIETMSVAHLDEYIEMGERARSLANGRYSESNQIKKFKDLFDSLFE